MMRGRRARQPWSRQRQGRPALGEAISCVKCGQPCPRTSGTRRYCDVCRKIVARQQNAEKAARYVDRHRREISEAKALRRKADPFYVLSERMGHSLRMALQGAKDGRRWETFVPYTLTDLTRHLERQFLPGMNWSNFADWHIDHIVPRSAFHYTAASDDAFQACWALTNLRPMWAGENLKKSFKRFHLL